MAAIICFQCIKMTTMFEGGFLNLFWNKCAISHLLVGHNTMAVLNRDLLHIFRGELFYYARVFDIVDKILLELILKKIQSVSLYLCRALPISVWAMKCGICANKDPAVHPDQFAFY